MRLDRALATRETLAGNDAFLSGDYGAAISAYQAALGAGADSADLWFNLGNAQYRAGQKGQAALAFERALRRDPGDADARANLELIRAQGAGTVVGASPPPFMARLGARVDPAVAEGALLLSWLLSCALLIAWLRSRGRRGLRLASGLGAALLLCGTTAAGVATWAAFDVRSAGWSVVVVAGEVREAPEPNAKVAFPVEPAVSLQVMARLGSYAKVELPGGLGGWIEAEKVQAIDDTPR